MKYIIDIEDEPYMREDGVNYYTCKSARWYKLGETIINRLEPYTEPDRKDIEDEVWDFARRIICPSDCCEDSISKYTEKFLGIPSHKARAIFKDLSYQEVKAKYEAWMKQKDDNAIKQKVIELADEIGIHKLYAIVRDIRGE